MTRRRAVLVLSVLLAAWTGALYARAALDPPPGRAFVRHLPLDRRLLQLRVLRAAGGGRSVPLPQQAPLAGRRRGAALAITLGTVLGLVRPYDLVLLGAVRLLAVAATEPARRWLRAAVPLLGLLPVLAYDVFVFFGSDQFASFRRGGAFPPRLDFVPALGPAAALALASLRRPVADHGTRRARAHLWAWAGSALLDRHGVTHVVVPGDAGPRPGPPARRAGKIAP